MSQQSPKSRAPIQISSPSSPHYHRMKYFDSLRKQQKEMKTGRGNSFLQMPHHLIRPDYFIWNYKPNKKQSSLVTIFSIWNTMVGSTLLAQPWAFAHAGLLVGSLIALSCMLASLYTCTLIVKTGKGDDDFSDTAYRYLGKSGWVANLLSSVLLMLGATLGYYQLLTQTLYPCILGVINMISGGNREADIHQISFSSFSLSYVCIGLSIILFFVFLKRDFSFFVKINTFGVFFVLMILIFNYVYGIIGFSNTDYEIKGVSSSNDGPQTYKTGHIYLISTDFGKLAGMLGTGYFLHNIILALLKNNQKQQNNIRDTSIGFLLVFLSYTSVGAIGYFGFVGNSFDSNQYPALFSTQISLSMFSTTNPIAFVIRLAYFFQIFSVLPLLFSVTRTQFFGLFQMKEPSGGKTFILFNSSVLLIDTVLGIVYPNVGSVMAYVGAFCGFILIYIIPILVHFAVLRNKKKMTIQFENDESDLIKSSLQSVGSSNNRNNSHQDPRQKLLTNKKYNQFSSSSSASYSNGYFGKQKQNQNNTSSDIPFILDGNNDEDDDDDNYIEDQDLRMQLQNNSNNIKGVNKINKERLLRSDIQPSSSSTCISKKWNDESSGTSFCLSLIGHSVLILFGLLIILFQFIQLN